MKIALISTPFFGVYPPSYGGLEVVVGNLFRGLIARGHRVVLFAPDESQVPEGGFVFKTGKALSTVNVDWLKAEREMLEKCAPYLDEFDVINEHNWFGHVYRYKAKNINLKILHTHHGGLNMEWWGRSKPPFKLNFVAISNWMKRVYESQGFPSQVCYNGVDLDAYPFQREKGERLLFLGRIARIKAPELAIRVAERSGCGLDVVGGTTFVDDPAYVDMIRSMCGSVSMKMQMRRGGGGDIKFIGEVDHQTKLKYLQNAKALLIPSRFGEPFGLIAVEAMACGTVPIALRDGALEEIIEDEKSGFICDSIEEMVEAVSKIETISPEDCRKRASHFSKERMAERMEFLFEQVIDGYEW